MSNTAPKAYFIENPVAGWAQMPYNTRKVLTESGEWTSPITGYVKVTCIGGGQAGLGTTASRSIIYSYTPGGDTSFGGISARGGGTLNGGAAGEVVCEYMKVSTGDKISHVVGAGGVVAAGAVSADIFATKCSLYPSDFGFYYYVSSGVSGNWAQSAGGTGGSNGTPYGGGGGAGSASGSTGVNVGFLPRGSGGGGDGSNGHGANAYAGAGGSGAIILEYADPKKKD